MKTIIDITKKTESHKLLCFMWWLMMYVHKQTTMNSAFRDEHQANYLALSCLASWLRCHPLEALA